MPANPVRVENIKAPELAVKGASERKYCRGIYGNKIHVKDTIMVPIYEKFNIQIPESLYRSKLLFQIPLSRKKRYLKKQFLLYR